MYIDESFPRLVGPFGGNPGTVGRFRLKHGSDVHQRLASGEVPLDFDALPGDAEPVQAKGPLLMISETDVWEWTGANGAGFGDPVTRDPEAVLGDVFAGFLTCIDGRQPKVGDAHLFEQATERGM